MTLTHEQKRPQGATNHSPEATEPSSPYQPCDNCGAPLDQRQRYCVVCGERRKHADDPAARFLSSATRRRRTAAGAKAAAAGPGRRRGTASLATAAMIAVIPVTLGAGVLIGRSSAGGDGKLIAALRAQKAPVIQYSGTASAASPNQTAGTGAGAGASTVASASTAPLKSTFSLAHGYAVQLGTLAAGTSQATATRSEKSDEAKGAKSVGIISQADFTVTPSPAGGVYIVYSGSYSSQSTAQAALTKLKGKFPGAKLIKVQNSASAAKGAGKVLTTTHFGSAHAVSGYKPSNTALQQGAQVAQQDSHDTGKQASGSGLPDVVAVP